MNEKRAQELLNTLVNDMVEKSDRQIYSVVQTLFDLGFTRHDLLTLSFRESDISREIPGTGNPCWDWSMRREAMNRSRSLCQFRGKSGSKKCIRGETDTGISAKGRRAAPTSDGASISTVFRLRRTFLTT